MSITINRYIKWLVGKLPLRGIIACTNERLNLPFMNAEELVLLSNFSSKIVYTALENKVYLCNPEPTVHKSSIFS